MKKTTFFIFILLLNFYSFGQKMLPDFSVTDIGRGRAKISWINPYPSCIQLMVQRSYDSLKFFKTVFTAQSPQLPQNGYIDNGIVPGLKTYYRIFYVLSNNDFYFTKSKQALKDEIPIYNTLKNNTAPSVVSTKRELFADETIQMSVIEKEDSALVIPEVSDKKITQTTTISANSNNLKTGIAAASTITAKNYISIYKKSRDSFLVKLEYNEYKKFRDSIVSKTKDTLFFLNASEVFIKPYYVKPMWKPSSQIFTNDDGFVSIKLASTKEHHYKIIFTDSTGNFLFEIKHVKEDELILDKSNFLHAGWFYFELFEDEKLKEKNKFFISKEF